MQSSHRVWPFLVSVALTFASTQNAYACDEVYLNATRNLHITESSYSELNALYDQYCSYDGKSSSRDSSFGIDVVVKKIPVKFTGQATSSSEAVSNFCRNYRSVRFAKGSQSAISSEVVVDALEKYNECRRIASNGVLISHTFVNPGAILFDFKFGRPSINFQLQSVTHGPAVNCGSTALSGDGSNIALDGSKALSISTDFNIQCTRVATQTATGQQFDATWIGLGTNFGSYGISLPQDEIYNNDLKSETTKQISDLQEMLNAVNKEKNKTQILYDRLKNTKLLSFGVVIGQRDPGHGWRFYGCGSKIGDIVKLECPKAISTATDKLWDENGDQCGYAHFTVSCVVPK